MDIRTFRTLAGKNRYALFASACLIPATCIQPALAAEEPEEVIVTGSRIRQNPVERAAPVQTATAADIDRSGEVSVADASSGAVKRWSETGEREGKITALALRACESF